MKYINGGTFMTVEKLQKRLNEIQRQKETTLANYNALCGAEQILTELINNEMQEEKTEE